MRNHLTPICDNKSNAHLLVEMPGRNGMRAYCKLCRRTYYLRMNKNGAPDKRQYAKLFYRDIIQPNHPLYYKFHREKMKIRDIV